MRNQFDDFDREFEKTSRMIRWGAAITLIINLALLALFIAALWAVGRYVGVW